jgi:YggT family protein
VRHVAFLLFWLLQLWVLCAIARALMSWFPISYDSPAHRINTILVRITEPLIAPVRRLLPPVGVGGVGVDLAFLVVIFAIQLIAIPLLRSYAL